MFFGVWLSNESLLHSVILVMEQPLLRSFEQSHDYFASCKWDI